jgi:hypothetical protein
MKNTITRLAFSAMIALSLLASGNNAFAQDVKSGRETAWTIAPLQEVWLPVEPVGVTWEE